MSSHSIESVDLFDGTWDQIDALRDLLRDLGSSHFRHKVLDDGAWWVVATADDCDQPAARVYITTDGRVRCDYMTTVR